MGINVFPVPTASGGGIKSVQRGSAAGSGNVTITAVDTSKSFVTVFGSASSGTVAASGTLNAATGNTASAALTTNDTTIANFEARNAGSPGFATKVSVPALAITLNSTNLTGGSNNLVSAVVQGYLSNSTTLVVSGACRWEVVEFN